MMNAEQTLLAARPDSSRLNDDSRRCCSAAPTTSASTTADPASAATQIAGRPGDLLPAEPDGDDGAERRTGGDAERVRRRQRVAEHRLKQRAGERQRAAGEQARAASATTAAARRSTSPVPGARGRARGSSANGPTNGSSSAAAMNSHRERHQPTALAWRDVRAHEYDTHARPDARRRQRQARREQRQPLRRANRVLDRHVEGDASVRRAR